MTTVLLEQLCRCCLNECVRSTQLTGRVTSFDANVILDENFTYADAIYMCTSIRCDERDGQSPKSICDACMPELVTALLFRTKCLASDSLLRDRLSASDHELEQLPAKDVDDQGPELAESNERTFDELSERKCSDENLEKSCLSQERSGTNETQPLEDVNSKATTTTTAASNDDPVIRKKNVELITYKKYKCLECAKEFHSKAVLDVHRDYHQKTIAGKKFVHFFVANFQLWSTT